MIVDIPETGICKHCKFAIIFDSGMMHYVHTVSRWLMCANVDDSQFAEPE